MSVHDSLITYTLFQDATSIFEYGIKGTAKYQLKALATRSHKATQTIYYDCKDGESAPRVVGINGNTFELTESQSSLLENVDVELNCQVSVWICVFFSMCNNGSAPCTYSHMHSCPWTLTYTYTK